VLGLTAGGDNRPHTSNLPPTPTNFQPSPAGEEVWWGKVEDNVLAGLKPTAHISSLTNLPPILSLRLAHKRW